MSCLDDPFPNSNWKVVEEFNNRKNKDQSSDVNVTNEINFNICSSNYDLVVELGSLPFVTTLSEVSELSVVVESCHSPFIDNERQALLLMIMNTLKHTLYMMMKN